MGFPSISATDRKSPIDRMFSQGLIKRRVFCFILHHKDGKRAADGKLIGGEMQIGGELVKNENLSSISDEKFVSVI